MNEIQKKIHQYLVRKQKICNTVCAIAAGLALLCLIGFLQPMWSIGKSMLPTISNFQFLVCKPRILRPNMELHNGDIVIIQSQQHARLIKRLIAQPGDTLEIRNNQVYVNGALLLEPYLYEDMITRDIAPITLGEDMYFVLGDNRNISADSRYYGFFTNVEIVAVVEPENQWWHRIAVIALLAVLILSVSSFPNFQLQDSLRSV